MVTALPTRTRAGEEEFLDLICHDPELLAAEFEAIIAGGWPDPPEQPPRRDAIGGSSDGARHSRRSRHTAAQSGGSGQPGIDAWSRPRSPPVATTTTDQTDNDER